MIERTAKEPTFWQQRTSFSRWPEAYLRWGTSGYPRIERRRLVVANLVSLLASLSCTGYAILFATQDMATLGWAVWSNLVCAALYLLTPLWHRWGRSGGLSFGSLAGAAYLTIISYLSTLWFSSRFGIESGIHLNFLTAIALATVVIGNRWPWLLTAIVLGWLGHVYAHSNFSTPVIDQDQFGWLLQMLYINTVTTFVVVVGLVVWYAFRIASEAEERTDRLLRNILPDQIATRLKYDPDELIADRFGEASVLFADLVGFTPIFGKMEPEKMVGLLNEIFTRFDELCQQVGVEKIKTIGDAYMVLAGAPVPNDQHASDLICLAVRMLQSLAEIDHQHQLGLQLRIGIASGPITAGVIGRAKYAYDVWAPTVNLASRLESSGEVGRIHVSEETRLAAVDHYHFEPAEKRELKGIGYRKTWFVSGPIGL